jgi:hypothetical protein
MLKFCSPRVAFVVKNSFQLAHFWELMSSYTRAEILLVDRPTLWDEFSRTDLESCPIRVSVVSRASIAARASEFDALFFQTVFPGVEEVEGVPLVSVQYGLAKERHNYGEWRSLADLNLMYGDYSASKVSHFSPSYPIGNVKFSGWSPRVKRQALRQNKIDLGFDPSLPVVLYMPTYGELGTFSELLEPLSTLRRDFNVAIKMHHNNEISGRHWRREAASLGISHLFGGGDDQRKLLEAADVVLSDYSGAIFDAVYAEVPVVLYQPWAHNKIGVQKFDLSSIEFRRRDELGLVVSEARDLARALKEALATADELVGKAKGIRSDVFCDTAPDLIVPMACQRVDELLTGRLPKQTTEQRYVRESVRALLSARRALNRSKSKPRPFLQRLLSNWRSPKPD